VRVVKAVRTGRKREVTVTPEGDHLRKRKSEVAEESTNFYATNFELGAIPPLLIQAAERMRRPWQDRCEEHSDGP
jgi:hypothetical protein